MEKLINFEAPASDGTVTPVNTAGRRQYSQFVSGGLISQSSLIKYRSTAESAAAVAPAEALFRSPAKVEGEVLVVNGFPAGRGGSVGGTDNSKICPHWDRYRYCANRRACKFVHESEEERSVLHSVIIANDKPTQVVKPSPSPPWSCITKSGKKLAAGASPYIPIRTITPMALPTPTSTPTPTPVALQTPTPMAMPTSKPTPMALLTSTPTPLALPTSKPTPSPTPMPLSTPPLRIKPAKTLNNDTTVANTTPILDWTPDDDGIEVTTVPPEFTGKHKSAKEDLEAYMNEVLYGKSGKKRLPVFKEFCAE